jgi:hypothetical protein
MSFISRLLALSALLLTLSGCDQQAIIQKFTSPGEQALAKGYIDQLRTKQLAGIEAAADPIIASERLHGTLSEMAAIIPAGEPTSVTLVGAHRTYKDDTEFVNLTYQYGFAGKWMLIALALKNPKGSATITGFTVNPQLTSVEESSRFTLGGKGPLQYLVLLLTIAMPILTLYALVVCAWTKLAGRKWPWILFILVGFTKFAINWATGEWTFMPVAFQLLSASAAAPLYSPWVFAVSVPLGAIVFLLRKRALSAAAARIPQVAIPGSDSAGGTPV